MVQQSKAKNQIYYTVYKITLTSNCEGWRVFKFEKKLKLKSKIKLWVKCIFYFLNEKIMFKFT
jgi:hypothetical protein